MLYVKKNELCVDLDERRSQKLAKKENHPVECKYNSMQNEFIYIGIRIIGMSEANSNIFMQL